MRNEVQFYVVAGEGKIILESERELVEHCFGSSYQTGMGHFDGDDEPVFIIFDQYGDALGDVLEIGRTLNQNSVLEVDPARRSCIIECVSGKRTHIGTWKTIKDPDTDSNYTLSRGVYYQAS